VEASCTWILEREEYREWKSPSYATDRPEVLWIYGKAGIGKTFLSARIIEDLKQTSSLPAVFFFATHEDSRKMEPSSVLRSWIFQLASTSMCAFEELHTIRKRKDSRKATDSELWGLFSSCLGRIGRCFLLVDGYDELSNEMIPRGARVNGARETFLKELFQSVIGSKAHIILISRNEIDIRRPILEARENGSVFIRTYCICPEDTAKDIVSFSRQLVGDRLKGSEVDLQEEIAETLSKHCEGMFLWVRLCGAALYPGRNAAQLRKFRSWLFCYFFYYDERESWSWKHSWSESILLTITNFGLMTGVRYFVEERKTDVDLEDPSGLHILLEAAGNGNVDIVSLCFDHFDSKKWEEDDIGLYSIFEAAADGDHAEVFEIFLERGFYIETLLEYFHMSLDFNTPKLLKWFLDHGAHPDSFCPNGRRDFWDDMTPLQRHACEFGFDETLKNVELLLENLAEVNFPLTPPIAKRWQPSGSKGRNIFLFISGGSSSIQQDQYPVTYFATRRKAKHTTLPALGVTRVAAFTSALNHSTRQMQDPVKPNVVVVLLTHTPEHPFNLQLWRDLRQWFVFYSRLVPISTKVVALFTGTLTVKKMCAQKELL
jgi:hypothetical protein